MTIRSYRPVPVTVGEQRRPSFPLESGNLFYGWGPKI